MGYAYNLYGVIFQNSSIPVSLKVITFFNDEEMYVLISTIFVNTDQAQSCNV